MTNSGARYLSVPVCSVVVVNPVSSSSRNMRASPKSHILGRPDESIRTFPCHGYRMQYQIIMYTHRFEITVDDHRRMEVQIRDSVYHTFPLDGRKEVEYNVTIENKHRRVQFGHFHS
jgi:hypothetical protein